MFNDIKQLWCFQLYGYRHWANQHIFFVFLILVTYFIEELDNNENKLK